MEELSIYVTLREPLGFSLCFQIASSLSDRCSRSNFNLFSSDFTAAEYGRRYNRSNSLFTLNFLLDIRDLFLAPIS